MTKGVDFFTAESFGVNVPPKCRQCKGCKDCKWLSQHLSRVEQRELEVMRNNLQLNPVTNKWETEYPYKVDPEILSRDGDNRDQAVGMMIKTENRLGKDLEAAKLYCEQFRDTVSRGVFRLVSRVELSKYKGARRYISHHEVFKEDSASTPIRLVLNTSLRYKGLSLNDILMKGPNALNNLFKVQLKFRSYIVALVCDLKKMYQSINTTITERYLRLVVWRDMDTTREPDTYGTETVTFGDKPAAAISAIALRETAELYKHINEEAAAKIKDDMYVDDIATGAANMEGVQRLKEGIKEILAKGGFQVKGFVTSGDVVEDIIAMLGTGEMGRILGIGWNPLQTVSSSKCVSIYQGR